ncbi:MAG TPA: hypothetical protein PLG15_03905 [Candidatus Gastranaerophilaceae bacterium]|nr:hypothetical protein [Candidatus Gastranaerophilaceae bacterium]
MKVFLSTVSLPKVQFGNKDNQADNNFKTKTEKQSLIEFLTQRIAKFRAVGENNSYAGAVNSSTYYLNELKQLNIKTVIDLSDDNHQEFKNAELNYFNFAIPDSSDYDYDAASDKKEISEKTCKFFEIVNKGNFFICCNSGVVNVGIALYLNALLNPKFKDKNINIYNIDQRTAWEFLKIHQCFTDEDKKKLGYTEEFEKRIKKFSDEKGITPYL